MSQTSEPARMTWSVIRFLRTRDLPRFRIFLDETWTTSRSTDGSLELGDGEVVEGRDYEVVYRGPRQGCAKHEVHQTDESRRYHGLSS